MRESSKIIFKIAGGVVAAGGDVGIAVFQHIRKNDQGIYFRIPFRELRRKVLHQYLVTGRSFYQGMVTAYKYEEQIVKSNQRNVPGHNDPDFFWMTVFSRKLVSVYPFFQQP